MGRKTGVDRAVVLRSLGAALVWSRSLDRGLFYALALSFNWILGAASYYVFPSLGPAFNDPSGLPRITTAVAPPLRAFARNPCPSDASMCSARR